MDEAPKPREWWIEEDPEEKGCSNVTFDDPRPAAKGWVYHVIEHSAYLAEKEARESAESKYLQMRGGHEHVVHKMHSELEAIQYVRDLWKSECDKLKSELTSVADAVTTLQHERQLLVDALKVILVCDSKDTDGELYAEGKLAQEALKEAGEL